MSQIGPDGQEHPVVYGGRSLRTKEKNWTATEIEALALITAITGYHSFLANSNFIVYSDHISLKWLQSIKMSSGRLDRWSLLLQGYIFEIRYKKEPRTSLRTPYHEEFTTHPHPSIHPDYDILNDDDFIATVNEDMCTDTNKE